MADITLINIPMAKNWRSSSSGTWVRSWTTLGQHLEGPPAAAGDVRVARGGGEPVQLDLEQLGVLHQLQVGRGPWPPCASSPSSPSLAVVSSLDDPVAHQVVGGHEQVLLGAEQAEQVGLGDPGPGGDGLGGGPGVAGPGELGDGRGQHGGAPLVCGLSGREPSWVHCECSLTTLSRGRSCPLAGGAPPPGSVRPWHADRSRLDGDGSLADTVLVSNRGPLAFHLRGRACRWPATSAGGLAGSLRPMVVGTGATWVACALGEADRAAAEAG